MEGPFCLCPPVGPSSGAVPGGAALGAQLYHQCQAVLSFYHLRGGGALCELGGPEKTAAGESLCRWFPGFDRHRAHCRKRGRGYSAGRFHHPLFVAALYPADCVRREIHEKGHGHFRLLLHPVLRRRPPVPLAPLSSGRALSPLRQRMRGRGALPGHIEHRRRLHIAERRPEIPPRRDGVPYQQHGVGVRFPLLLPLLWKSRDPIVSGRRGALLCGYSGEWGGK